MKLERTKNAKRNIIFGTSLKLYQILMPFALRTIMIYGLGLEYVGLNSLFTSILQVLNLAELGVGSAMVFSMYKPVAEADEDSICALMGLYKKYYRIIGIIILSSGLILTPALPYLIKSDLPADVNLYVLYFLNLGATVLSYWLFAYKNCLFAAHQRNDIVSKVTLIVSSVEYILQAVVLIVFKDYYLYLIIRLFTQVIINISTAFLANNIFPKYKPVGKLPRETVSKINKRICDLFTAKIGAVVVNSADSIVISAFLGLNVLAIYNNYYYILTSIMGIVSVVFTSCTAGIGNSLITETKEKNFSDFNKITLIIVWLTGFCVCCLMSLYQPFMEIWTGKLLGIESVICLCVYFFVYEIASLFILYKDAAGIWHEDRFRPLITALTNLLLNLILVQYIDLFGVLLSTILAHVFIGIPWLIRNLSKTLFKQSMKKYVLRLIYYVLVTFVAVCVTYCVSTLVGKSGVKVLIMRGCICALIPNIIFYICYFRFKEFGQVKKMVWNMVGKKAKR